MVGQLDRSPASADRPVTATASVSIKVMHDRGGFLFDRAYYFDPEHRWRQDVRIVRWCEETFAPYPVYNAEAHLIQLDRQPRPYRQIGGLQPNLILGAALGAEFLFPGDLDPDITPAPLRRVRSLDELGEIRWEQREPIRTFLSQIDGFKKKYDGEEVDLFPPFFWDRSGRAAVHGPLTTAQKLMGEEFMLLLYSDPEFASGFLRWIAESYATLIRLFAERAEMEVTGVHIGECSGCMFSAETWEAAAVPAMDVLIDACGPARMHSCGKSDHLLTEMAKVRKIAGLNIGSGTSIARCRELAGLDMPIDVIPDMELLCRGNPRAIRKWVETTIEENAGGPLEIQFHIDAGVPMGNAVAIFETLERYGATIQYDSLARRWGLDSLEGDSHAPL